MWIICLQVSVGILVGYGIVPKKFLFTWYRSSAHDAKNVLVSLEFSVVAAIQLSLDCISYLNQVPEIHVFTFLDIFKNIFCQYFFMLELVWIFCLQVSVGIFGWVWYNPKNVFVYLVSIIGTRKPKMFSFLLFLVW